MRQASQGSPWHAAATANAAGTDSWVARLVPTSRYTVSMSWSWPSPVARPVAQEIRAATSAPAAQCPRPAAPAAAATARLIATGNGSPSIPALTAIAMAAAPASATPVLWVSLLEDRVVAASATPVLWVSRLAGAAAVAMAVSAGIDGDPLPVAIARAVAAAASAAGRGHWAAGADVAARITWATGLVTGLGQDQLIATVNRLVGTSLATQESVPAAFAIAAACPGDPWLACRIAASLGGDCDTIAAMTGAICGACHGSEAFPDAARPTVAQVNGLDLAPLADELLAIRTGRHD